MNYCKTKREGRGEEGRIYCENDSKKLLAEATLTTKINGEIDIEHVFVDSSLRGQGVAGKVMEKVTVYKKLACKKMSKVIYINGSIYEKLAKKYLGDLCFCNRCINSSIGKIPYRFEIK